MLTLARVPQTFSVTGAGRFGRSLPIGGNNVELPVAARRQRHLGAGNYLAGNGLGGVTLHAHAPGENFSGNTVTGNKIGTNNLDPDFDFVGFGPQFFDAPTTGVIIAAASNVTITIAGNKIYNNVNGVWLGQAGGATITAIGSNHFVHVENPVVTVS